MPTARTTSAGVAVLRAVHDRPGIARAEVSRRLGLTSGFTAETVARLSGQRLLEEAPAPRSGGRGRPTTALGPHPEGPLVAVAAIAHERWDVAVVALGGGTVSRQGATHDRRTGPVLAAVAAAFAAVRRRHGGRIRAVAVAVPGTVTGSSLVQAPNLRWHDVDLAALWPSERSGRALLYGNDATFAAVAEARRGSSAGVASALHLYLDAGVGGAVIEGGEPVLGAHGMAGEFGHMPLGDPSRRCACGAHGCWNTTLDGAALAAALGRRPPADEVSFSRRTIARAATGAGPERGAVEAAATSLGRGTAGLVNALDPAVVTVGGIGRELLAAAPGAAEAAYRAGLMQLRTTPAPVLAAARLGEEAPLLGAVEQAFAAVLSEDGLHRWAERRG